MGQMKQQALAAAPGEGRGTRKDARLAGGRAPEALQVSQQEQAVRSLEPHQGLSEARPRGFRAHQGSDEAKAALRTAMERTLERYRKATYVRISY